MNTIESVESARVFVADDTTWVCTGENTHRIASSSVVNFCRRMQRVDVFGCPSHAKVICSLYDSDCQSRLRIGTPQAVRRYPPDVVARNLCELSTSVDSLSAGIGGWHAATAADYWTYRLCQTLNKADGWNPAIGYAFKRHPVWPVAAFASAGGGRLLDLAYVVASITDPRWFVDPAKPSRISRLRSYFRLTPANMRKFLLGSDRCDLRTSRVVHAAVGEKWHLLTDTTPTQVFHETLFREPSNVRGLIRASELLLALIRQVWLHVAAPHGNELFVPEYFFERTPFGKATADAFRRFYHS